SGAGAFASRRLFRAAQGYRFASQQDRLSLLGELEAAILLAGRLQSLASKKLTVDGAPFLPRPVLADPERFQLVMMAPAHRLRRFAHQQAGEIGRAEPLARA